MSLELVNGRFQPIEIKPEAIGSGAEGDVYEVVSPASLQGYVVKIYHDAAKAPLKQEKIEYLIKHKPQLKDPLAVIFPEDIIYQHGKFIGFLMKRAIGHYDLTSLCTYGKSQRLPSEWHYKYNRNSPQGLKNRMRVCYNIAAAINQIHRSKKFTFVDLKPENIKINFDGKISIVDIDSISIANGEELIFPAEKFTPEYSPAEYNETNLKKDVVDETWDRFSISILFYKVLFGIHPYAGTAKGNYSNLNSNEQKIQEGLFPQGEKSDHFEIIPKPHTKFKEAPRKIQQLFINCFEEGHHLPSRRPTAADWCKVLVTAKPRKYFWKTLVTSPDTHKNNKKTKKTSAPTKSRKHVQVNSTSGALPSFLLFFVLIVGSLGIINYSNYQKSQRIIQSGDKQFGKNVEASNNDIRTAPYDKFPDKDYFDFPSEGVSLVLKNGKWGYLHVESQKIIVQPTYDWAHKFQGGLGRVRQNGKFAYVDRDGRFINDTWYDDAYDFKDGRALVLSKGKYMFINTKGNMQFTLDGDRIYDFKDGLALFKKDGMFGFINEYGEKVIPPAYDMAYPFKDGLAAVQRNGKWGYINTYGHTKIAFEYDDVTSFSDGIANVFLGNKEFMIDKEGNIIKEVLQEY